MLAPYKGDIYSSALDCDGIAQGRVQELSSYQDRVEYFKYEFDLVPNPAKDVIHLKLNTREFEKARILVYSLLGKKVKEVQLNNNENDFEFSIGHLDTGTYFFKLVVDNQFLGTKKVIIE